VRRSGHHGDRQGLDAYVAVDASGTFSETSDKSSSAHAAGRVILSDYATLMWKS